ncbi:copper-binding protein [Streptomyces spongiicola]|uniref:Copper-binding protein n=1 Tax=Streptomyces spongiicola TaxID=1690221 RepID=A0A2S1YX99_9ACTN|nr:heavy-metal-associated domain-containing protein [Streptomyces spongiicola]AWK08729.1 copper-binding protein [Streptomyces spongiicola]GBP99966.1 copper-binding protein [Streptomyces spongiicola]
MTAETNTGTIEATGSRHSDGTAGAAPGGTTAVYLVKGMTCGHCEGAVSEEISGIAGVTSVQALAATGQVTVVSAAPLDEAAVRAAVDEAGYEFAGPA